MFGRSNLERVKPGEKYGSWTVIEIGLEVSAKKRYGALCRCVCGVERPVASCSLVTGLSKSCGCRRKLPKGKAAFNRFYADYKKGAKGRGYGWGMGKTLFRKITKMPCAYCGALPSLKGKRPRENGAYVGNGIDRVNNRLGYTPGNCVPCCKVCNRMKLAMTVSEFVSQAEKIAEYAKGE